MEFAANSSDPAGAGKVLWIARNAPRISGVAGKIMGRGGIDTAMAQPPQPPHDRVHGRLGALENPDALRRRETVAANSTCPAPHDMKPPTNRPPIRIDVPPARIPEEPAAVISHAGICKGASGNRRPNLDPKDMSFRSITLLTLALSMSLICLGQEPTVRLSRGRVNKTSMNFSDHLDGPAKWNLGAAGTLTLKMNGDSTIFLINGDQEVFRLSAPEYIDAAVMSQDGMTLVFVAMKRRGYGSDFAALVRIRAAADGVKIDRVLESGEKLFDGRRWWLSELGAISNDGKRALAKFGIDDPDSHRMGYRWFTVELGTGKILSEGLRIENGNAEER